MLAGFAYDLRYALRMFSRRPGFTALVVLTLATGIGAAVAVFSIVHAVLLRPLPYSDPERVVAIWDNGVRDGDQASPKLVAFADFEEYRRSARFIEAVSAVGRSRPLLNRDGVTRRFLAGRVTAATFTETLRVDAALGRTFTSDDEKGGCTVVLAHRFWTTVLGGDASVAGGALRLDEMSCTVVGVLPAGFSFFPEGADMWFLRGHESAANLDPWVAVFARLKAGATVAPALADLTALHGALHASDPAGADERNQIPAMQPVRDIFLSLVGGTLTRSLWLASAAVLLVMLLACLNVANLLMARVTERRREMAVRAALGSGRSRLIRQVLTEGLLLSLAGTVAGVGIAGAALRGFRALNPLELPGFAGTISLDVPVLIFALALTVTTTLVFGMLPAVRASGPLRCGRSSLSGGVASGRVIVAAEVALSFVLLAGGALLLSSAFSMTHEELGFAPDGVAVTQVTLPASRYQEPDQRTQFQDALLDQVRNMPGVESAALGWFPPYGAGGSGRLEVQGEPASAVAVFDVENAAVSPKFFEVLKTPLLRGRPFDERDRKGAPMVAIVSSRLVREYFGNRDPLGRQIRVIEGDDVGSWATIIGAIGAWKHTVNDSAWRDTPMVFLPIAQHPYPSFGVAVRLAGDLGAIGRELQRQIASLDTLAATDVPESLDRRLAKALVYPRFRAFLSGGFAAIALVLAAVGIYGVLAQLVSSRIPEFGVRRAVGAQTADLLTLVGKQGAVPVLVGLGVGLAGALASSRILAGMVYGIRATDARVLAGVAMVVSVVAAIAMARPALRAASVDPMIALREE